MIYKLLSFLENFRFKVVKIYIKIKSIPSFLKFWFTNLYSSEGYGSIDEKSNLRSEPPENASIELQCVWASEIYTPKHFSDLLKGFSNLGWGTSSDSYVYRSPYAWVRRMRKKAGNRGMFNLGQLLRLKTRNSLLSREIPLPYFADKAYASMHYITDSVLCVVVCFVVKNKYKSMYGDVLRNKYLTRRKVRGVGRFSVFDPTSQKRDVIGSIRNDFKKMSADWFRKRLPGVFSSGVVDKDFVLCEYVKFGGFELFEVDTGIRSTEWLSCLGLSNSYDAWASKKYSNVHLMLPLDHDERDLYAILASQGDPFEEDRNNIHMFGDGASVRYVDSFVVNELLSRVCLLSMITGLEGYLNRVRDIASMKLWNSSEVMYFLEHYSEFIGNSLSFSTLSEEIKQSTDLCRLFSSNHDFDSLLEDGSLETISLCSMLCDLINRHSEWLCKIDNSLREVFVQHGSVVSAYENIKLQIIMKRMTWVMLFLTVVATYFAVVDKFWK